VESRSISNWALDSPFTVYRDGIRMAFRVLFKEVEIHFVTFECEFKMYSGRGVGVSVLAFPPLLLN
jgi:hypothetical protein